MFLQVKLLYLVSSTLAFLFPCASFLLHLPSARKSERERENVTSSLSANGNLNLVVCRQRHLFIYFFVSRFVTVYAISAIISSLTQTIYAIKTKRRKEFRI